MTAARRYEAAAALGRLLAKEAQTPSPPGPTTSGFSTQNWDNRFANRTGVPFNHADNYNDSMQTNRALTTNLPNTADRDRYIRAVHGNLPGYGGSGSSSATYFNTGNADPNSLTGQRLYDFHLGRHDAPRTQIGRAHV